MIEKFILLVLVLFVSTSTTTMLTVAAMKGATSANLAMIQTKLVHIETQLEASEACND